MGTIFILFVLIVALIGLVGVRMENYSLQKTNRAYKGANTKHKETIEKLEGHIKKFEFYDKEQMKQIDESKIVTEKLLTMVKKGNMEEAKEVVKSYYESCE